MSDQSSLADEVPSDLREIFFELVTLTDRFCAEHLDDEYKEVCRRLAVGLCQPGVPITRGKRAGWACGIVYTVGWANFLTDPNTEPHLRPEQIYEWFGVSQAAMFNRVRDIREGFDLLRFDPELTVRSRMEKNPFAWTFIVNGIPVDVRYALLEVQQAFYEQGLIPYVPGERNGHSHTE
jgi:hypothetical protein